MKSELVDLVLSIPDAQDSIFALGKNNSTLSQSDLCRCTRVSKLWFEVVTPFLWKKILVFMPLNRYNPIKSPGLRANAKWIRNLELHRQQSIELLVQTGNCINLKSLTIALPLAFATSTAFSDIDDYSESEQEATERKKNESEARLALKQLISQNPQLIQFRCRNSNYSRPGLYNQSVGKVLMETCSIYLLKLEFFSVVFEGSSLSELLHQCKNLKELEVVFCTLATNCLENFKGPLDHLETFKFENNYTLANKSEWMDESKSQDWVPILKATAAATITTTTNSSKLRILKIISSLLLSQEKVSDLISACESLSLLTNVSDLYLNCIQSDRDLAKILKLLGSLKRLQLENVSFGQESLAVIESKHQENLEAWHVRKGKGGHQLSRFWLNGLRLPKLGVLTMHYDNLSFQTLFSQVYEDKGNIDMLDEKDWNQDDTSVCSPLLVHTELNAATQQQREQQQQPFYWSCPQLRALSIRFTFDPTQEISASEGSLDGAIVNPPEELYVKVLLFLIKQVSRLPGLVYLDLNVPCEHRLDPTSEHWQHLEGSWTWLAESATLGGIHLVCSVPSEIQARYDHWYEHAFKPQRDARAGSAWGKP